MTNEIYTMTTAAAALKDGAVSATELAEAAIAAATAKDEDLGIYMRRFDAQLLETAAKADAQFAAGGQTPPMLGLPLGIKDIISTSEGETTAQSLVLDRGWGERQGDAEVVRRLRDHGALITGKTTTMEFATGIPDPSKPFPVPRNPWNSEHWTGGSSSGTGNGVVAGAMLGGLGTDTGGSIRLPAAYCGISGLKATFGRVPKSGCVPLGYSLDHIGPMAASAADCALMLNALAGANQSDPTTQDVPVVDYLDALSGDVGGLRIGIDPLLATNPDRESAVDEALAAAVALFQAAGARVEETRLPLYAEVAAACRITSRCEALSYHLPDLQSRWGDYFNSTRTGVASGAFFTGADYVQAQRVRRHARKLAADELWSNYDLILTPTTSSSAPALADLLDGGWQFSTTHTGYWNALGNPALSVPMGFDSKDLPLSLQIVGRPFDEATVLRAGDTYQRGTAWHLARPAA
ncbi:amidase [Cumulibacter soli]|uniref:amidase n=1 Tax=Cumulibacter soli TaxID=2546344 RepID=UPI001068BF06|nr:amidase [Cumulibacter soli]